MNLDGQVAIVTGGGRGLGRAYAVALAAAGAAVAIVARTETEIQSVAQEIVQSGGQAFASAVDVTDGEAVAQMVDTVTQALGPVDLLINNAGTFRAFGMTHEVDPDLWWREIETNVRGPFLCTRAVLPTMIARQRGRIINLVSMAGLNAIPLVSAYCLGKAALIRFTENVAAETPGQGIAVFAVHPGTVRTPMNAYVHDSESVGKQAPAVQQWFRQLYAEGKDTPIERSVELVLQLASGQADGLSGRFIDIDADLDDLILRQQEIQEDDLYTLRLRTSA